MNPFRMRLIALLSFSCVIATTKPVLSLAGQYTLTAHQQKMNTDIADLTVTRMPDHAVIISWTTEKEGKDDYYEIEKSLNGKDWTTVAVALAGTGIENNSYEYIDKNAVAASLYYRIRQRDGDGKDSFSAVTTVEGETRAAASIFFADRNVSIRLYGQVKEALEISLLDQAGHILQQKKYNDAGSIIRFSVADLPPGHYTLNIKDGVGLIGTRKLVIR